MTGYLSYFKLQIKRNLQYKASAISGLTTQFFLGIIYVLIYSAFYKRTNVANFNIKELMCYVWLNQAFLMLIYIGIKDKEIITSIKNGEICYELTRPYDLYSFWYIKLITNRYASVILRCAPIIIFSLLLPKPFNLSIPYSIKSFILFIISMFMSSLLIVSINMIIMLIAFFTNEDKGITSIIDTIGGILSGFEVPLLLLPPVILKISNYLPFRYILDLPFRIYSGNIKNNEAIFLIKIQILWTILLIIMGRLIMKYVLKHVSNQGG